MNQTEMVIDFKLRNGEEPITVASLMEALNTHIRARKLQPDEYDFQRLPSGGRHGQDNNHLPQKYRWLIAFFVKGDSEGYYIHVAAVDSATQKITDLGVAKTYSADNAGKITLEAQRFLTAALWN